MVCADDEHKPHNLTRYILWFVFTAAENHQRHRGKFLGPLKECTHEISWESLLTMTFAKNISSLVVGRKKKEFDVKMFERVQLATPQRSSGQNYF